MVISDHQTLEVGNFHFTYKMSQFTPDKIKIILKSKKQLKNNIRRKKMRNTS